MKITASLVKELRERTGVGMMDCKKALEETNGDIEKAVDLLREKGMAQAEKRQGRIAAEGLTNIVIEGNIALLYEINAETDFASQNKGFLDLIAKTGKVLFNSNVTNTEEALALVADGITVEQMIIDATTAIGEKITLRNVQRVVKEDNQIFGDYKHLGGRITALTILDGSSDNALEVARDVAMQVTAMNPQFLDRDSVDPEVLEREKKVLTEQALAEGRPEQFVERIISGRLSKFLEDICLVDQKFVKDGDLTVGQYVKQNGLSIVDYYRLEVGDGIEKKEEDFAAEVAAQMGQ